MSTTVEPDRVAQFLAGVSLFAGLDAENRLKVAKVTGGTASKVGKIRLFRKNIARVLTAISHKAREKMRSEIKAQCGGHGLKRVPKQLRAKKTRAIRRQLTPAQLGKTTVKAAKKARNFPLRQYVVEAS